MNQEMFDQAVALAERRQHSLISTVDVSGVPHITSIGSFAVEAEGFITLGDWYCPKTLQNLDVNPRIALVVWDIATDRGFQLFGEVRDVLDVEILDGPPPGMKERSFVPQVERVLRIEVDKVYAFSHAPHSDEEPEPATSLFRSGKECQLVSLVQ